MATGPCLGPWQKVRTRSPGWLPFPGHLQCAGAMGTSGELGHGSPLPRGDSEGCSLPTSSREKMLLEPLQKAQDMFFGASGTQ